MKEFKLLTIFLFVGLMSCGGGGGSANTDSSQGSNSAQPDSGLPSEGDSNDMPTMPVVDDPSQPVVTDDTPEAFDFADLIDVEPNALLTTDAVMISGINTRLEVEVFGAEYSVDGGAFTTSLGEIDNEQTIEVRLLSSSEFETQTTATVRIGNITNTLSVTTRAADTTIADIQFEDLLNQPLSQRVVSQTVQISDIEIPVAISIEGGEYAINSAEFASEPGMISSGDSLQVRLQTAARMSEDAEATITIGGVQVRFVARTVEDTVIPTVAIVFPKGNVMTSDNELIVRGTAADNNGVTAIMVNGIEAETSNDFAEWAATVPLVNGSNVISVEATDLAGLTSETLSTRVEKQLFYEDIDVITLPDQNNTIYAADESAELIMSINLDTGVREVVSSLSRGTGELFNAVGGMVVDGANQQLFLADSSADAIWQIDIQTGDRELLSDTNRGTGLDFRAPYDISFGPDPSKVYVVDWIAGGGVIFEVDKNTGDRMPISGNGIGSGISFDVAQALVYDRERNVFYVADSGLNAILMVDVATGDRTVLSNAVTGSGDRILSPRTLLLDEQSNQLFTNTDYFVQGTGSVRALMTVSTVNGERAVISGLNEALESKGTGDSLGFVFDISRINGNVLVSSSSNYGGLLFEVATSSGDRVVTTSPSDSYKNEWQRPQAIQLDKTSGRLIVGDNIANAFFKIDLSIGEVSVLFTPDDTGLDIANEYSTFVLDDTNENLFNVSSLLFGASTFRRFDLSSGVQTTLSGEGLGTGSNIIYDQDLQYDPTANRLIVSDSFDENIKVVDIATGNRSVLSGQSSGSGAVSRRPHYFDIDVANNRLIVADLAEDSIYSVDLNTGHRSLISNYFESVGDGGRMEEPRYLNFVEAENSAVVLNKNFDDVELLAIDLQNGERSVLATIENVGLLTIEDMAFDSETGIAYFVTGLRHQLVAVDTATEQSVLLFK